MKIQAEWDDDNQQVLRVTYARDWTWQEHHTHNVHVLRPMIEAVGQPVNLILDMSQSPYFQPASFASEVQRCVENTADLPIPHVVFVLSEKDIAQLLQTAYRRFSPNGRMYSTAADLAGARALIAGGR